MNRYARERRRPANAPKVEHVELDDKNIPLRVVGTALLIIIAVAALTFGISGLFKAESGWLEIEVGSTEGVNCSDEFTLYYDIPKESARTVRTAVTEVYTAACEKAYELFYNEEPGTDTHNLYDLNLAPNTELEIDPALYAALEEVNSSGSRYLFYAPLYPTHSNLCTSPSDTAAEEFDPLQDADTREYYDEVLAFANDPSAISIRLSDGNIACLTVSEEYLAWAERNEVTEFADFYALRNAFAADYIADCLQEAGYTACVLSSAEGFIRMPDGRETTFALTERKGSSVYAAANVTVSDMTAVAALRDHAISSYETGLYYCYENGEIRMPYLSEDGTCVQLPVSDVAAASDTDTCAELCLKLLPYFTGSVSEIPEALYTVYCSGDEILCSIPGAVCSIFHDSGRVTYQENYKGIDYDE